MKLKPAVILLGLSVLSAAYAQPPAPLPGPPPGPPPGHVERQSPPGPGTADAEMTELIETVMAARLAKELGLNDEQTVLMVRRFSEFRDQLNELKRRRQEKLKALRTVLREKRPDSDIEQALQDLIAHDLETLEFRKGVYQKAAGSLSTAQRAKLYVFISDFEGDMRRLIQKARERRMGPGRPPIHPGPGAGGPPEPPQRPRPQRPAKPEAE